MTNPDLQVTLEAARKSNEEVEALAEKLIAEKGPGYTLLALIMERDGYQDALRYIAGEDVAGMEGHRRPQEVARAALAAFEKQAGLPTEGAE